MEGSYKAYLESVIGQNMIDALYRYLDHKIPPGSFLEAVLCNDLVEACGRADDHNRKILFEYVQYLYNHCPSACFGSKEKFQKWIAVDDVK